MSINKAQGQPLKLAGNEISDHCFAHGRFYVGCSRVSWENNLYIHSSNQKTNNIMHQEIF